jgi:hypothetical protein
MKRDESVGRVRVVALMGSYRKGETIDRAVGEVLAGARGAGAETEKIDLVDRRVEFCWNCRECCREPGRMRGRCVRHADDVDGILAALEGADAVVFGGGIGEHAAAIRARICEPMGWAGLQLDAARNDGLELASGGAAEISGDGASLRALVVAVDEEELIAADCRRLLEGDAGAPSS